MTDPRRFDEAIRSFWTVRESQAAKQVASGKLDAGTRGAVTGGAHLDAIAQLLEDVFVEAGFARSSIRRKSGIELPVARVRLPPGRGVQIDDGSPTREGHLPGRADLS